MKKLLSRMFNSLPKRLAAGAIVALALAFPVASMAAETVQIEGSLGVANVTNGDTQYQHSVNATYDQVVKFQVYYHNRELPDSGKVAQNLKVKIALPTAPGTTQTTTTTISADNSNVVTDSATVNTGRADAYLQYIPGSAVWKHNTGTNDNLNIVETPISDNVVTSGQGVVLENEQPCYNFAATVTVLARVMIPGVKIVKEVEKLGQTGQWNISNTANPGDTLKYRLTYQNTGNTMQNQVVLRDNLPPKMTLVPGTTVLTDGNHQNGITLPDDYVTQGGEIIGNYSPGLIAYLVFEVKVPTADQLACGDTTFTNVGVARPQGMNEYYNTAITTVNKVCANTPAYSCDTFDLTKGDHTVTVSAFSTSQSNGATFKNAVIDWGDGTTPLTTNVAVGQTHKFAGNGPFKVGAVAHFTVNGQDVTASGNCNQTVSFTSVPAATTTVLPNTGAGDVIAIFGLTTVAAAFAHRLFLSRRLVR